MSVSQTRRNQIESHLAKLGISATDEAISGVIDILKTDQRATVASACRRYASMVNPSQQQPSEQPSGQTVNNATAPSGDKLQDTLSTLSNLLGDRLLEGVVSKAVDRCQDRLLSGDWVINSDAQKKLENLKTALDVEFTTVESNFLSLPSSDTSNTRLLPSSEEVLNTEAIPQ